MSTGWPVDSRKETLLSGVTRIKSDTLNSMQDGTYGPIGGLMTVTRITVDGKGGLMSGSAASGAIKAIGNIESTSGVIYGQRFVGTGGANVTTGNAAGSIPSISGSTFTAAGGLVNVQIGTGATGADTVFSIAFTTAYPSGTPRAVVMTPANYLAAKTVSGGANGLVYVSDVYASGFVVANGSSLALASGQTYSWRFAVIG